MCYIYGLIFYNVSPKVYIENGAISDTPREMELEPQSLSHVALSNAEALWKKREQREEFIKRRARTRKDMELQKKILELEKKRLNNTAAEVSKIPTGNINGTAHRGGQTLNTPKRRIGKSKGDPASKHDAAIPFVLIITFFTLFRLCFQLAIGTFTDDVGEDHEQQQETGSGSFWTRSRLQRRTRAQIRQRQFNNFVQRLNAQRVSNGERPITADSLRLVVSDRDFDGNDYDRLWQFHEEQGPAIGSFLSTIGATEAEIRRCPSRILTDNDDLVRGDGASAVSGGVDGHSCSVCLEAYRVGDEVRTIPCFHTFHTGCIDPWLSERAECPVCKHSAIG